MNVVERALNFITSGLVELFTVFMPFIGFCTSLILLTLLWVYLEHLRKKGKKNV